MFSIIVYSIDSIIDVNIASDDISYIPKKVKTFSYIIESKMLEIKCEKQDWEFMTHIVLDFYSVKEQRTIRLEKLLG